MRLLNTQNMDGTLMHRLTERRKVNIPLRDVTKHRVKGFFTGVLIGLTLISLSWLVIYHAMFQ